jgi:glycosyltransferase involved in cell wall biosynthesis
MKKDNQKKLTICFFGTYDNTYTSNKMVLQGLKDNDVKVVEVNAHTKVTRLDKQEEMNWFNLLKRIFGKVKIISEIIKNWDEIKKSNAIYVGYPGHVDVLPAFILAKILNIKLVFNPLLIIYIGFAEEQGILKKRSLMGWFIKQTESLVYKMCDLVFADTPFQEEFLRRDFKVPQNKLRVLPIGADDRFYTFTPYTNKTKKINCCYYGLYSPVHGVEHIIEAARILKDNKNITFSMIGIGNTFEQNFKKAHKLGLKNITFYHDVPESDHPKIMAKSDLFFGFLANTPTVDRVIPNKVYQGMAQNKLVVTADARVTRSVFKNGENMVLVKPANPKSLAQAIVDLSEHPSKRIRMIEESHSLFKTKFTPKAVGKQLKEDVLALL